MTVSGKPIIPATDILVKVGWNFFLVTGDSSDGIHNPAWVNDLLNNSIEALFPSKGVPKE
jgi:hypothetical protein